jgi:hypothetical protein
LNFEASLFQIESKCSYFAQERLQEFITNNNLLSSKDFELLCIRPKKAATLALLRDEAASEAKQNVFDTTLYFGRTIVYGQAFQLRHVNTNKFLSVMFGANLTDIQGGADVELTSGSNASSFKLKSVRDLKSDSEQCDYNELVTIVPEMLPSISLNARRGHVRFDKHNKPILSPKSVDCSKEEASQWLMSRYQSIDDIKAQKQAADAAAAALQNGICAPMPLLITGQVVRLLHQEADVFLAADPKTRVNDKIKRSLLVTEPACGFGKQGYTGDTSETAGTSYTLWMVENLDPTMSQSAQCGAGLRLRNFGTGGYLMNHSVVPSCRLTGFRGDSSAGVLDNSAITARRFCST